MADIYADLSADLKVLQDIEQTLREVLDAKMAFKLKREHILGGLDAIAELRGELWLRVRKETAKPDILLVN